MIYVCPNEMIRKHNCCKTVFMSTTVLEVKDKMFDFSTQYHFESFALRSITSNVQ